MSNQSDILKALCDMYDDDDDDDDDDMSFGSGLELQRNLRGNTKRKV